MNITFEQAREAVRVVNQPLWEDSGTPGTYTVATYGFEDEEHFLVLDGADEWLTGEDFEYVVMDAPALFVDKSNGTLFEADPASVDVQAKVKLMQPVGVGGYDVE